MNTDQHGSIIVPAVWSQVELMTLDGVLLVVGAPDSGKSTFARWLFERLAQAGRSVAFLDGDVGQSTIGLPTTLTLQTSEVLGDLRGLVHWFVGDVSPRGRMLPLVVGTGRLARRALESGAETVVVDTTGLIDPASGGVALKHALVDELQPTTLFALQRRDELAPILNPLRRLPRPRVVELPVSDVAQQRNVEARQAHRAAAFRRYFAGTGVLRLPLRGRAIFDGRTFAARRLLALQDAAGFALALGVIEKFDPSRVELFIRTPLIDATAVASLRLGVIGVDVETGRDFRPGRGE